MDIKLRPIDKNSIADKENYLALQDSVALFPDIRLTMDEDFLNRTWQEQFENPNRICYVVETQDKSIYCGECAVKDISADIPELSIELMKEWHHHGIGYQAIRNMLGMVQEQYNKKMFYVKIEPDNFASQLLFEKLGGVPAGIVKDYAISDDRVERFTENHKELLNEDIQDTARKFNVAPELLLTNLLVYRIDASDIEKLRKSDNHREQKAMDRAISKAKIKDTLIEWYEALLEINNTVSKDEMLSKLDDMKERLSNKREMIGSTIKL